MIGGQSAAADQNGLLTEKEGSFIELDLDPEHCIHAAGED